MSRTTVLRSRTQSIILAVALIALPGLASSQDDTAESELEALRQQVEELRNLAVRTQSHVMVDVEYHFSNLWYAGHNDQWELAAFYLRETDSHLRWTVRIRPVRSIRGSGGSVELQPFQERIEQSGLSQLENAIENEDIDAFENAYTSTMTECYACHLASGFSYLEPHIPEMPLSPLMLK
jgi:hypothetical protein